MPITHILNATRSAIFRAYGWKVISTTHVPTYVQPLLGKIVYALSSFLLIFFLVYKDEVGGWAPPTELSQSSGAAAHTYTWFSLTTYLLIYNVILEILFISRIQYSPVRRERGGGFVKAIIFARRIISLPSSFCIGSRILLLITNSPVEHGTQIPLKFFAFLPRANSLFFFKIERKLNIFSPQF